VIRGLPAYVKHQLSTWVATALHPLIEQEIIQGRVWGSKKASYRCWVYLEPRTRL